jgi:hypothetical protein
VTSSRSVLVLVNRRNFLIQPVLRMRFLDRDVGRAAVAGFGGFGSSAAPAEEKARRATKKAELNAKCGS